MGRYLATCAIWSRYYELLPRLFDKMWIPETVRPSCVMTAVPTSAPVYGSLARKGSA
jgi:hypothetical protein